MAQRYTLNHNYDPDAEAHYGFMEASDSGDYVLHADHLTALAAKDEQIRVLREALEHAETALANAKEYRPCPLYANAHVAVRAALSSAPEGEKQ